MPSIVWDLSIPLWCDWDWPWEEEIPKDLPPFNPTVVRLGPVSKARMMAARHSFNPTVVRLGHA